MNVTNQGPMIGGLTNSTKNSIPQVVTNKFSNGRDVTPSKNILNQSQNTNGSVIQPGRAAH